MGLRTLWNCAIVVLAASIGSTSWATNPAPLRGRLVQGLNGEWRSRSDPADRGMIENWQNAIPGEAVESAVPAAWRNRIGGIDWFWKSLPVRESWRALNVRLRIPPAAAGVRVYINGQQALEIKNPANPLLFDVTKRLDFRGPNLLAIRLEGAAPTRPTAPPGSWLPPMSDGVEMVVSDEAHINDVQIEAKETGWVTIRVELENVSNKTGDAELTVEVVQANQPKRRLGSTQQAIVVSPGRNRADLSLRIKEPRFWSTQTPVEYLAAIAFRQQRDILDNITALFIFQLR